MPVGSLDKSTVLPVECRVAKCASLEIPITNVELREMTFTAASRMNTAAELRASAPQLLANTDRLPEWRKLTKESAEREKCIKGLQKGHLANLFSAVDLVNHLLVPFMQPFLRLVAKTAKN